MKLHKSEVWLISYLADFIDKYPEIYQLEVEIMFHSCNSNNYVMTTKVNNGETCVDSDIYSKYSSILERELNCDQSLTAKINNLKLGKTYKMLNRS